MPLLARICRRAGLLLLLLAAVPARSSAQAPAVTAAVEPAVIGVNQIFGYTMTYEGGNPTEMPNLQLPPQIGMASGVSQNTEMSFNKGRQSIRVRLSWALTATEPGDFVIPPQDAAINGQAVKTNEVKIKVTQGQPADKSSEPLLQLKVAKTEIYQGEVVPVTASLYIGSRAHLMRTGLIEVPKNDLAIQRFPLQSEQADEIAGDEQFRVYTYRSTLSALKPGRLKVGPAQMEVTFALIYERRPSMPGFNRMFEPAMVTEPRKATVKSSDITVTVLPLPDKGKPPGFTGAVGEFTLAGNASPTSLSAGDPITVEMTITGAGNFDALTSPQITDASGWKIYPARRYNMSAPPDPGQPMSPQRQIGFTQVIVPERPVAAVPPFELSWFSPQEKKYVTQRTPPIPIVVNAPAVSELSPSPAAGGSASPPDQKPPAPQADITDILLHLPASPALINQPQRSWLRSPVFWAVNSIPLAAFLGLLFLSAQRRKKERLARDQSALLRKIWSGLRDSALGDADFYRLAARFIQAANGIGGESDAARDSEGVSEVLARYHELNFAGSPAAASLPAGHRKQALAALEPLLSAPASRLHRPPAASSPAAAAACAAVFFLSLAPQPVAASGEAELQERYEQIVAALKKGDHNQAQALAESLLGDGFLSPELFEILGHTRYRQGDLGRSALWYQRAALFSPSVAEIRQNLRHLREKTQSLHFSQASPLRAFGLLLLPQHWLLLASAGGWLLLLGAGSAIAGRARGLGITAAVLGFFLCTASATGAIARPSGAQRTAGLHTVTAAKPKIHTAASSTSGTVMDLLPAGSTVRLLEKRGAWSYIEIPGQPDPLRGWIETDSIASLWPWPAEWVP